MGGRLGSSQTSGGKPAQEIPVGPQRRGGVAGGSLAKNRVRVLTLIDAGRLRPATNPASPFFLRVLFLF